MEHNMMFKHSGKCAACGEDTQLLIHQECGEKLKKERKKRAQMKLNKKSIDYLSNTYS